MNVIDDPDDCEEHPSNPDSGDPLNGDDVALSEDDDENPDCPLSLPEPSEPSSEPGFDTYQDLYEQDPLAFGWDANLFAPEAEPALPPQEVQAQQALQYYGQPFMPTQSIPQAQALHTPAQNQALYGQMHPSMSFGIPSMLQTSLTGTHVMPSQFQPFPANTMVGSNEPSQSVQEQGSHIPSFFPSSAGMPLSPTSTLPSVSVSNDLPSVQVSHRATDQPDSPGSSSIVAVCSSDKENVSPNDDAANSKTNTTKAAQKRTVAPRPKVRPVPKKVGDSSWCMNACNQLRRSLKGPDACEAVVRWKDLEELLGYPGMSKVSTCLHRPMYFNPPLRRNLPITLHNPMHLTVFGSTSPLDVRMTLSHKGP